MNIDILGAALIHKYGNINFMIRNNILIWDEETIQEPTGEELQTIIQEFETFRQEQDAIRLQQLNG